MICATGKVPSRLPQTFNHSTGKFSTQSTGFNNTSWGGQAWGLVKLIIKKLWLDSYDKIVEAAREFVKKTHGTIHTNVEVIDLTNNDPPEEFGMLVDVPSDEDDEDKHNGMSVVKEESEDGNVGFDDSDGDEVVGSAADKEEEDAYEEYNDDEP